MLRVLPQRHSWLTCNQRNFFTLPKFTSSPDSDLKSPLTQTYHERKIFPYERRDLYNLVADVGSYTSFVPYCASSRILERSVHQDGVVTMDAELTVAFFPFKESYVSRVTCRPFESVQAEASTSTPLFKTLQTVWRFQPALSTYTHPSNGSGSPPHGNVKNMISANNAGPTLVMLDLTFAFENPLHSAVSATFFGNVSKMMVQAFEERCLAVYGSGTD